MNFNAAIEAWKKILTEDYVLTSPEYLKQTATATFPTTAKVHAVLLPPDVEALKACLRIANKFQTPVYPISQGMNFGYGSKVPSCEQSVIIQLSRMNRILDFDPTQGVLTVEAGVTFEQAFEFLSQQKTNFVLAGTGAPPGASLVGNSIERGIGKGLASNRIDHICNFEVVLPTGESFSTGLGRFENAKGKKLIKWGPGPFFDGMFTQSNLGIVTKMSFWLTPIPKHFQTFVFSVKDKTKIPFIIDALHDLKQRDVLRSSTTLFNSHRILSFMGNYPWDLHDGKSTLSDELALKALIRTMPVAAYWYGDGALYSNSFAQAWAERRLVKKALKGLVTDLNFFYEPKISVIKFLAMFCSTGFKKKVLPHLNFFFDKSLYSGHLVPKEVTLGSTYLRLKSPPPPAEKMNPNLDNCGTYWLGPIVPFDGGSIEDATAIIQDTISKYGFEPAMTLQMVTARQIDIIASITYDRGIPGEDAKARKCHDELFQKLVEKGLYPYRLGTQSHSLLPNPDDDFGHFMKRLKQALDPNDILAPGRYDFRTSWRVDEEVPLRHIS